MGEHSGDAAVLVWIKSNKWDTTGDGNGNPRDGMWYYQNVDHVFRVHVNGAWQDTLTDSSVIGIAQSLSFRFDPTANGIANMLGWYDTIDQAQLITTAAPFTPSVPGFHAHYVLDVSGATGLPFTIRFTGTTINESNNLLTPGDTEDLSITANGYYQTVKSWITAPQISILEASKSCTVDVYRTSYWDKGNSNFVLDGVRLEFEPDSGQWEVAIELMRVQDDGSFVYVDNTSLKDTDIPPRAANGITGKYERGDYSTVIEGAEKEGIIVRIDHKGIRTLMLEVKYHDV